MLTIQGIGNQPLTILGTVQRVIARLGVASLTKTITTLTQTLCAATAMTGMTQIGADNAMSLSCWSEADTIIATRDIGTRRGDMIPIMSGTITTDQSTLMAICCLTR